MDYRKYGDTFYIRLDRGDEIITGILDVCQRESLVSCTYSGIGGCGRAEIQSFIPATGSFETRVIEGMLELVSLTGNVVSDREGRRYHHTHAVLAYKDGEEHRVAAGHIRSIHVSYTAEITLKPVAGGELRRREDPETGTGFWDFES